MFVEQANEPVQQFANNIPRVQLRVSSHFLRDTLRLQVAQIAYRVQVQHHFAPQNSQDFTGHQFLHNPDGRASQVSES